MTTGLYVPPAPACVIEVQDVPCLELPRLQVEFREQARLKAKDCQQTIATSLLTDIQLELWFFTFSPSFSI